MSGALQVQGNAGDTVTSGAPLSVVPAIRVDATAVYAWRAPAPT